MRTRKTAGRVLAIIVAVAALLAGALLWRGYRLYSQAYGRGECSPNLAEISRRSQARFPRGARVLGSFMHFQWDGHSLYARLEMDRADADGFIRGLPHPKGREDSSADRLGVTRESWHSLACCGLREARTVPSWWDPDSVRRYRAVLTDSHGVTIRVLIDTGPGKRATVYLLSSRG